VARDLELLKAGRAKYQEALEQAGAKEQGEVQIVSRRSRYRNAEELAGVGQGAR
jgi:hypothetical protein